MGADPLAWMQDNDTSPVKEVTTKPVERRKKSRSKKSDSGLDVDLLEQTFAALAPQGEALVQRFYAELFERYPDVKPMFDNTTVAEQEKKLLAALQLVVNSLRKPEVLANALTQLGAKHHEYGAKPEHYTAVAETLLDVMAEFAGELWTNDVHTAWSKALNTVATIMLAAKQTDNTGEEDETMAASKKVVGEKIQENLQDNMDAIRMSSAINNAMTPIMMVDRNLVVTYANKATVDLLKQHEVTLQSVYAGFSADNLIGTNIDTFHKNPAHQRRLLSDPGNLPYQTDIDIGSLKFSLNVTAQIDTAGEYIGTTLEWSDVTEVRAKESVVARLQGTVDGAMTAMMMVDRDFVVTYANGSTLDLLKKHEAALASVYSGFSADNIVGSCIDIFHKNPAHQRKMLSDPANLPYQTDIEIGDLKFALNVTAIMDSEGSYVGNALEWSDVTSIRQKESVVARLQGTVDGAMTAMMMVDRDFVVTYANGSTLDLLKKHEAALASVYPGFSADNIVGSCIDTFHKNPAHQRKMLSDPANLPYQTDIGIGDLKFALNVTAIMDSEGSYVGNALEWSDVTELRAKESVVARLQGTVDGAMTAMMMVDRDFVVTYANGSTLDLLKKHEAALASVYPGFSADNIVGSCIDTFHKNPAHQRKMLSDPTNLPYQTDIEIGDLKFALNVTAIIDAGGHYVGNALEWSDVTSIRQKEFEVARLQSAVDGAQANFMLCDADLNITYCNPAVVEMMRIRQNELRQVWSSFNVDKLVGSNIDAFHKNPAHQRALLSDSSRLPAKAEIKVAGLEFEVNATMIDGPNGEYLGNMVEWKDITEQKNAERQVQGLIDGAVEGRLDTRITTDQFKGFLLNLGEGINRLMDAVTEPVQETRRVISGLADGDLTQSMDGEFEGEFAELRDAVNATMNKLLSMVNEIGTASGTIASAANEISQGTADLSQRSEEQASSLEETASSMEELTGTVRQNADNAREANQLANSARDEASKGGEVVGKAITAMSEINQSSKKIADIIGVIDEIAFQTNLLALNAAVEAARAGEQGRGFAVVAAEVRNLAQRSASAAKEIKSLINDSVEKVTEGSKLVDQSGATLDEIVGSVKKVSDIIAEIASAGQEQASGIDQINKAVTQMDEMTQQNAALVEEAAASSEAMNDQAVTLDELIGFFKTGENTRSTGASAPQRVARPAATARPASTRRPASKKEEGGSEWEEF